MLMRLRRTYIIILLVLVAAVVFLSRNHQYYEYYQAQTQRWLYSDLLTAGEVIDLSPEYDPYLKRVDEPAGPLVRSGDKPLQKAAIVTLVRNRDLRDMFGTVTQFQQTFNDKFDYPWIFFNDEEFTDKFKKTMTHAVSGEVKFVKIDAADWEEPEWIDRARADMDGVRLKEEHSVGHADEPSYKRMCRWFSGKFYEHPALADYKYYWRVEPSASFYCDIGYDVFAYMAEHKLEYGFVSNLYDSASSVQTLWPTVKDFFSQHPSYIHANNSLQWLVHESRREQNVITHGYSTCHFWSNFEIASLDFYRSTQYREYFEHLDRAGGFFYERWGDAPVHSIALGLMLDKSKIHWFRDIGYYHPPYWNCPTSGRCRGCIPGKFGWNAGDDKQNCMSEWFKLNGDRDF